MLLCYHRMHPLMEQTIGEGMQQHNSPSMLKDANNSMHAPGLVVTRLYSMICRYAAKDTAHTREATS